MARRGRLRPLGCLAVLIALLAPTAADGVAARAVSDVVLIVDTSTSMRQPGMDPERSSLLVSQLFVDIVPGEVAVVRLIDLTRDGALLPHTTTGETGPCNEDPSKSCRRVVPTGNWELEARTKRLGALARPARGDPGFRAQLDTHLAQRATNSFFHLAFRAAQGVLESHAPGPPKTVVWLSDGLAEAPGPTLRAIADLKQAGVGVEAVVFGRGDTRLGVEAGLTPERASGPRAMMRAFARIFRRIVEAPYEVNGEVASAPTFEMKSGIDESWIVVYGDDSLQDATLDTPSGIVRTDHAAGRHAGAGAYRVAYVTGPAPGRWTVRAVGGGAGAAYAVVQRSAVVPVLVEPHEVDAAVEVPLVVSLRTPDGRTLTGGDIPAEVVVEARIGSRTIRLVDDGGAGDAVARDGRFTGRFTFPSPGEASVAVRVRGGVLDRTVHAKVTVRGGYQHEGGPIHVDFGTVAHHAESCRPLVLRGRHVGDAALALRARRTLPAEHGLEVRLPRGVLRPGAPPVVMGPGESVLLCLVTGAAASSTAAGEHWLDLGQRGAPDAALAPIHARWAVKGLGFWARWWRVIVGVLVLVALAVIVYGYVHPHRFQRNLSVVVAPDRVELEEQGALPLARARGAGIGWYRHARAFVHANHRVSGRAQGSVASLHAGRASTRVRPENGQAVYRENMAGEWEEVPSAGRLIRPGEAYRIGARGPYFRTSATSGRRE